MKVITLLFVTLPLIVAQSLAQQSFNQAFERENIIPTESQEEAQKNHKEGSELTAKRQDELSADVQELIQSETNPKVIKFLGEAEDLMILTTDKLEAQDTSGTTIVLPTEIIEKIAAAAKERNKSSDSQQSPKDQALLQMMQQMLGNQGNKPSQQQGQQQSGSKAGEGATGTGAPSSTASSGQANGSETKRRLKKKSGSTATSIPREFQQAFDAFNKVQQDK